MIVAVVAEGEDRGNAEENTIGEEGTREGEKEESDDIDEGGETLGCPNRSLFKTCPLVAILD